MRPHAHLINCARGGVIVERDLLAALDANVLAGAAIDVVARGAAAAAAARARRCTATPRCIATPHLGGSTYEALARIATELAHDVARVLLGAPAERRRERARARAAPKPSASCRSSTSRTGWAVSIRSTRGRSACPRSCSVLGGALAEVPPEPLTRAFLSGLLQATTDRRVSVVNAERDRPRARDRRRRARRRERVGVRVVAARRRGRHVDHRARRSRGRRASSSWTATRSTRRRSARC